MVQKLKFPFTFFEVENDFNYPNEFYCYMQFSNIEKRTKMTNINESSCFKEK